MMGKHLSQGRRLGLSIDTIGLSSLAELVGLATPTVGKLPLL